MLKNGLYVGNTYFEHKNLHKYTRVAICQDGMEVKCQINLVLIKKDAALYEGSKRNGMGISQITIWY